MGVKKTGDIIGRELIIKNMEFKIKEYFTKSEIFESNIFLLDGRWGSGKTWVIDQVKNNLKNDFTWQTYSAWQYFDEKELFYDFWLQLEYKPITAGNLEEIFKNTTEKIEGVREIASKVGDFSEKVSGLMNKGIEKLVAINDTCEENLFLKIAKDNTPFLKDVSTFLNTDKGLKKDKKTVECLEEIGKAITKLNSQTNFADQIYTTTKPFDKLDNIKQTVIVIDDLDRIHEDKLWRVFMILSLFESSKNTLFILVGSSNYLINILDKKYNVQGEGENFLCKFTGAIFHLPEPNYYEILVKAFQDEFHQDIDGPSVILMRYNYIFNCRSFRDFKTKFLTPMLEVQDLPVPIDMLPETVERVTKVFLARFIALQIKYDNSYLFTQLRQRWDDHWVCTWLFLVQSILDKDVLKFRDGEYSNIEFRNLENYYKFYSIFNQMEGGKGVYLGGLIAYTKRDISNTGKFKHLSQSYEIHGYKHSNGELIHPIVNCTIEQIMAQILKL